MKLKVKLLEVEQGRNEVVLNEFEAKEATIDIGDRIKIKRNAKSAVAMVDYSHKFIKRGEVGMFVEIAEALGAKNGEALDVSLTDRPKSLDFVRRKIDGKALSNDETFQLVDDMMHQKLSDAELASWIAAITTRGMSPHETSSLTNAIYSSGEVMTWKKKPVVSEHSIGGVSGDRVSMLIVPIIASLGITIPKTASKAISSGCATADVMEVLAPVALSMKKIHEVVDKTNGCMVWGGSVNLAVADDIMIKLRMPLRLDPRGLVLSSIIAKKKAEGAQYVLLDIPVGRGAKVTDMEEARSMAHEFKSQSLHVGINFDCVITDGSKPMMKHIGPVLEARAVLEALQNKGHVALVEKACLMSGMLLRMVRNVSAGKGYKLAKEQVASGAAEKKFREIIAAQGGNPKVQPEGLKIGEYSSVVESNMEGKVSHIDNVNTARITRALGSPGDKGAGIVFDVEKGQEISKGDVLFKIFSSSKPKVDFAFEEAKRWPIVEVERIIMEVIR
jgi:AMP phosphorylase